MERHEQRPDLFMYLAIIIVTTQLAACTEEDEETTEQVTDTLTLDQAPTAANTAPTIWGDPSITVVVGSSYDFEPQADDADGDQLSFTVVNRPPWAAFTPSTGRLFGNPTSTGRSTGIVLIVSDGKRSAALPPFSISVQSLAAPDPGSGDPGSGDPPAGDPPAGDPPPGDPPPGDAEPNTANLPPQIGGTAPTLVVSEDLYLFTPAAEDADGDPLDFAITNKPAWLGFDAGSGTLSGFPTSADIGVYENITISVSDGVHTNFLPPFAIEVVTTGSNSVQLSWLPPTQNIDDSPLLDLAGFRIYYGMQPENLYRKIEVANPGITTYVIDGLVPGSYYFSTKAYNQDGFESMPTIPGMITLP